MKVLTCFFLLAVSRLLVSDMHPLHVSLTNIEYQKEDKTFKIAFKIFTDDFEEILNRKYSVVMNLGLENEIKNAGEYFSKYIIESFGIKFDGVKQEDYIYIKKEQNFEAVWLHFSFKPPDSFKSVEINDKIMFDMFNDQNNLVIFNYSGKQKAYSLNKKKGKY